MYKRQAEEAAEGAPARASESRRVVVVDGRTEAVTEVAEAAAEGALARAPEPRRVVVVDGRREAAATSRLRHHQRGPATAPQTSATEAESAAVED